MTDPTTQQTQGQQGQQLPVDDILAGEDIFAAIPEVAKEENTLGYDQLDKQYQFKPIPETIEEMVPPKPTSVEVPVQEIPIEVDMPAPIQPEVFRSPSVQINIPEPKPEPKPEPEPEPKPVPAPIPVQVQEKQVPEKTLPVVEELPPSTPISSGEKQIEISPVQNLQTDVQKKFGELVSTTKKIYELKEKVGVTEESFDILGANNDKLYVSYRFLLDETNEPILFITKIEQDKETEEETVNELRFSFNEETSSLEVVVNDTLLFDEVEDFNQDQKKKLQVVDKINKFTFLASEELRKMEKEIKEKEEAERERKKLQEIFRNF